MPECDQVDSECHSRHWIMVQVDEAGEFAKNSRGCAEATTKRPAGNNHVTCVCVCVTNMFVFKGQSWRGQKSTKLDSKIDERRCRQSVSKRMTTVKSISDSKSAAL